MTTETVIDQDTGEILSPAPHPLPATPVAPAPGAISQEREAKVGEDGEEQPLFMRSMAGALVPLNEPAVEWMKTLLPGQVVSAPWRRVRNWRFHRKFFALLRFAFQYWEPPVTEYKGHAVAKSFRQFRNDVMILSGHFRVVARLDGSVRLEPVSISFAQMDDQKFEVVYQDVFNVIWDRVCATKFPSQQALDQAMNMALSFE